jgi:colicin import membrane protein
MNAAVLAERKPPRPDGMGRGAMLALLVHVGLLVAIAFGVSWRSSEPAGTSAELWAAVPQAAAPAAVEPPPPPLPKAMPAPEVKPVEAPPPPKPDARDADIAVEKAEKAEKAQREREAIEQAKKLQAERDERRKREEAEKLKREAAEREQIARAQAEELRKKNVERMLGQAGATGPQGATGTAQRSTGASSGWGAKIRARVQPNIKLIESVPPDLLASVELRVAPDGTITARRLVKSSGNAAWDEAVLRAIDRTESLPKDDDGRVQPVVVIDFKP